MESQRVTTWSDQPGQKSTGVSSDGGWFLAHSPSSGARTPGLRAASPGAARRWHRGVLAALVAMQPVRGLRGHGRPRWGPISCSSPRPEPQEQPCERGTSAVASPLPARPARGDRQPKNIPRGSSPSAFVPS